MNSPRLIEHAFPLKQASLDSVHEKNVRHGHISTLHIWPARRPLAACRAALIATLLPDPGTPEARRELCEKIGGKVVKKIEKKKMPGGQTVEREKEETEGGILHWGRETANAETLEWFRQEIRKAYGGRAPKVLDPFAGGGAIPLEAMRLGCEITAVDINPVAWFILKCTLEYPQRLANQHRPLPAFACESYEFMESYFKAKGFKDAALRVQLESLSLNGHKQSSSQPQLPAIQAHVASVEADLAWHVRAWGWWVLQKAKADLARFYPTVDGKPTVAYLWARTVTCKNCRATVPLLKTRWLCKKENKRVVLNMKPNADKTSMIFGVQVNVPPGKGSAAVRREYDKQIGSGTMSRSGITCPSCGTIMMMEDIRLEGQAGRLGTVMTAVVVDGEHGKEYRLPIADEILMATEAENELSKVFTEIPFGLPEEPLPSKEALGFRVPLYGFDRWYKLFTPRQLVALGTFAKYTRAVRDAMQKEGYSQEWVEAISAYLVLSSDRVAERNSSICHYDVSRDSISGTFQRYALPISWDFAEAAPTSSTAGSYDGQIDWVARYVNHAIEGLKSVPSPQIENQSAIRIDGAADLMDFFYVWLRRSLNGLSPIFDTVFHEPLSPKWDKEHNDGELIDDSSRFGGDKAKSKANYEDGMARVFQACYQSLNPDG